MDELNLLGDLPLLQAAPSGGGLTTFLPIILIFVVFYLFFIRPQRRRQQEQKQKSANLQKGEKIITIGGIHGVVVELHDKTVTVKTGKDSHIEFSRSAIATVVSPQAANATTAVPERRSLFGFGRKVKTVDPAEQVTNNNEKLKDTTNAENGNL